MDKDVVIFRNKKDLHRQCKVVFSYQPVHPDELMLNVGDIIDIIGEDEEGWWKGVNNGKEGVFPSNFVEEFLPTEPKVKPNSKSGSREDLSNVANDKECIPNLPPKPSKILCEVKYAYKAQNEDELTLKEGDIITLTNKDIPDPGWWEGELSGRIGVFPDNFVVIIKQEARNKDDSQNKRISADSLQNQNPVKATVAHRASLEPKVEMENKLNPPILKKPDLFKKISPSSVSKGFRGFVGVKKGDSVDGLANSKNPLVLKNDMKVEGKKDGESAFDQVERTPLLKDVRAGRAKPPVRRPPTSGVVSKDKSPLKDGEVIVISDDEVQDVQETKPPAREWEKHKAPWLEEMKLNQAKRSSTSPISEKNVNTKLYPDLDKNTTEGLMSKSMPCPVTSKVSPNESLPVDPKLPKVSKSNNLQIMSRSNYSNVEIPLTINNFIGAARNSEEQTDSNEREKNEFRNNLSSSESMTLTVRQYDDILLRIQRLESIVELQAATIDDLKTQLKVDRRIHLQNST